MVVMPYWHRPEQTSSLPTPKPGLESLLPPTWHVQEYGQRRQLLPGWVSWENLGRNGAMLVSYIFRVTQTTIEAVSPSYIERLY